MARTARKASIHASRTVSTIGTRGAGIRESSSFGGQPLSKSAPVTCLGVGRLPPGSAKPCKIATLGKKAAKTGDEAPLRRYTTRAERP
jgi:hypothetical protein